MSHKKHVDPPKVDPACDHTHDDIVCKSLTVKGEAGGPHLTAQIFRDGVGLWLMTGQGNEQIGLVAQKGGAGPALVLWGGKDRALPAIAIGSEGFQLPAQGHPHEPVFILFADLLAAVRQVVAPKPE